MVKGRAWRTECQKAVGVWPESVRPERSVMVPEIMTGSRTPFSAKTSSAAKIAALAFSVSKIVSISTQVGAAVDQPAQLLAVGRAQLVEADGAEARVVDVRRHRGGAVGRPERAGDEAPPAVLGLGAARRAAHQPRAVAVQLVDTAPHAVVGLGDGGRGEGVGLDDVGAGDGVAVVDLLDRLGLGQDQQVVVALLVVAADARSAWPRNSSSPKPRPWICVPIAPSRIRIRSRAAAVSASSASRAAVRSGASEAMAHSIHWLTITGADYTQDRAGKESKRLCRDCGAVSPALYRPPAPVAQLDRALPSEGNDFLEISEQNQ